MDDVREARPDELGLLPALEEAADAMFLPWGIGPLPPPGTVEELAAALAILVSGEPPGGFCRIDLLAGGVHIEQLSVPPEHGRQGRGRALVRAACGWATTHGYREITLATYRDVPWNAPFYASEGFADVGPVDAWYAARGLPPEDPVMGRGGARVLMRRPL
ncbi:MAG TPA: GNAT family N-acetyltransferase [Acidimicrobiales bacterium]|nr:GNAT family N-acetyltransferase [Acidimicrobiales bacterium]